MTSAMDAATRGLLRQALAEAIGGFAAGKFPADDRLKAVTLWQRIESESNIYLSHDEIRFFLQVLQFALKELGPEEFQTITGYDFEFGVATAKGFETEVIRQGREMES